MGAHDFGGHTEFTKGDDNVEDVEWGFNCLTQGVHHGRPEALWNVPLLYAAQIFPRDALQEIVVSRIYNDAMQFVNRDQEFVEQGARETVSYSKEWADRVKARAEELYRPRLQHKVGELSKYYRTPGWKLEAQGAGLHVTKNNLNPGYAPLHPHDSINMLCRIIGVSSLQHVSEQQ